MWTHRVTDMRISWALSRSLLLAELTKMPSSSVVEPLDDKRLCRPTRPFQPRPGEPLWTKHTHTHTDQWTWFIYENPNFIHYAALVWELLHYKTLLKQTCKCNLCIIFICKGDILPPTGAAVSMFFHEWNSSHTESDTVYWSFKGFKPQASRWNQTTCPEHKQKQGGQVMVKTINHSELF